MNATRLMPHLRTVALSLLLAVGSSAFAAVKDRGETPESSRIDRLETRHYVLDAQHALRPYELQRLEAAGCSVQKVTGQARYIVRIDRASTVQDDEPLFRSLRRVDATSKVAVGVRSHQALLAPMAELNVLFHDDVTYDAAVARVLALGGRIDNPLRTDFDLPRRLLVQMPKDAIETLAADEAVYAVFGRSPHTRVDNAGAAILSSVTPLFSAPYGLSGAGVTAVVFDIGAAQASHKEFGGRLTTHATTAIADHPTHVSGTIGSAGMDPQSKGMAPSATIHQFDINDNPGYLDSKKSNDVSLKASVDSNSWGYILGWDVSTSGADWVWTENEILFGAYSFETASLDHLTRSTGTLMTHSAGNDAATLGPTVTPYKHLHVDPNTGDEIDGVTWCFDATATAAHTCAASLTSAGCAKCENEKHPPNGPYGSVGLLAAGKDTLTVGAMDNNKNIASFSSRGPTQDGRVKPDLVAKGVNVYSTVPTNSYIAKSGTSMSTPVVAGISVLLVEQWRKLFNNADPTPLMLKTLLIEGAQDLGNVGPDYTFGFGLANAQASIDLMRTDAGTGTRIRSGSVATGAKVEIPFTLAAAQNVRVTLGWSDPETVLGADELADATLINDLDLAVIDANGNTVLPYVLDMNHPEAAATRGRNSVDNTEQVELTAAPAGNYKIVVTGTSIDATYTPQDFVVVANAPLGGSSVPCSDMYEPNESAAAAFGYLASGETVSAKTCSSSDVDFFKFLVTRSGTVSATVVATDTPLKVTLAGASFSQQISIAAGATGTVSTTLGSGSGATIAGTPFTVKIEPDGSSIGASASYTLTPSFGQSSARKRSTRH